MEMDINDWGLQKESFGFGEEQYDLPPTDYMQMSRSNTGFLNAIGDKRKQKKELEAVRQDYFKRIDALPVTDTASRDALFNELEAKLKQMGAEFEDINEAKKAKRKSERGEKIAGGLQSALNIFTSATQALGIGKKVPGEPSAPPATTGLRSGVASASAEQGKVPMWVWVVSGVAVLGLGVFAIYKFRR